jgi:hypothetical protein
VQTISMAITFEYCLSCGGKTQIDTGVRAADRRCTLCGGPCSDVGEIEAPASMPEWMRERDAGDRTYSPVELVHANCPRCRADIAINPDISLAKQRCHACGMLLADAPRKSRMRKRSKFTSDGVLTRRTRERVWMPMVGTVLVVVPALIFGIWLVWRKSPEVAAPVDGGLPPPRVQIRELVAKFSAAKTPGELLPLIRDPDKFEKPLRDWCASHPGALPLGGELMNISYPRAVLGTNVAEVTVNFKDSPATQLLTVDTPAGYRLEWRAFTGLGDMSVADFLAQKPTTPVLLMTVVHRSDYYNNAYTDGTLWQCLRIRDSTGRNPFFAYVSRSNQALMAAIADLPEADSRRNLKLATVSRPMALRVCFTSPGSVAASQAEVESIAGDGWYVP